MFQLSFIYAVFQESTDKLKTLAHEHVLIDNSTAWKGLPKELSKRSQYKQKVTLENRSDVLYYSFDYLDNLLLDDVNNSIENIKEFIGYGGKSIIDLTLHDIGRDPDAIRYISIMTGANIIMGSGRFVEKSIPDDRKKSTVEDIAKEILSDFNNGVGENKIKPGIIGEIGISNINSEIEINSLRGAAMALKKIGCGLNVHVPFFEKLNHKILDILEEEKVDLNKVVLSHCDATCDDWEYHDSLAKRGATLEYDEFGTESYTDYRCFLPGAKSDKAVFLPYDGERINAIKKQIELGNIDKIVISGDMCFKILYTKWGGPGYSHILKNIFPRMKNSGITDEQIFIMTVENPKKLLQY